MLPPPVKNPRPRGIFAENGLFPKRMGWFRAVSRSFVNYLCYFETFRSRFLCCVKVKKKSVVLLQLLRKTLFL
jgi:hypothetical protein